MSLRIGWIVVVIWGLACLPAATEGRFDRGGYLGGSFGVTDWGISGADLDDLPLFFDSVVEQEDSGWKLYGGYQINRYFGAEAGMANLGSYPARQRFFDRNSAEFGDIDANLKPFLFFAEAVGVLPIGKVFAFIGKAGFARWDVEFEGDETLDSEDEGFFFALGQDGTDLVFGAGFEVRFGMGLTIRVEWERFLGIADQDLDFLSGGVLYRW